MDPKLLPAVDVNPTHLIPEHDAAFQQAVKPYFGSSTTRVTVNPDNSATTTVSALQR
jgi:hypothetical protein